MNTQGQESKDGWPIFELWSKYEDVAMHFNDLLMKLRTSALAGIAAISTVVGLFTKDGSSATMSWEIATAIFVALCIFWIAIWILDFTYYNRLLLGAADALIDLEAASKQSKYVQTIDISTKIKAAVDGQSRYSRAPLGGIMFYSAVLAVLISGVLFCLNHIYPVLACFK